MATEPRRVHFVAVSESIVLTLWPFLVLLAALAGDAEQDYRRGVALFQQGKPIEALQALEAAVKSRPKFAEAWKVMGVVYAAQGDYPMAEPVFEKACRLAPKLEDACFYHGRVLYLLNRFDDALAILKPLSKSDPRAHRIIALCLDGLGRWPEAEAAYRQAIRHDPGGEDPRIDYGVALVRQGEARQALSYLREAEKADRQPARASLELGRALVQLDRLQEALPYLQKCVSLEPQSASGHLLLGRVYLRLGMPDRAKVHLELGARAIR